MLYTNSLYHNEICEPVPNGITQFRTPSGPFVCTLENKLLQEVEAQAFCSWKCHERPFTVCTSSYSLE